MTQRIKPKGKSNIIDQHIGGKIRERRKILGIAQTDLAAKVGVSFQQIQKYENGKNRVAASKLILFSQALEMPLIAFYPDPQNEPTLRTDRENEILKICRNVSQGQMKTFRVLVKALCNGGNKHA